MQIKLPDEFIHVFYFIIFFPKEKLLMTILFLSTKEVLSMLLTCVLDVSNWKENSKYKYRGVKHQNFLENVILTKFLKIQPSQYLRGGQG
jgi:hypothetical protein